MLSSRFTAHSPKLTSGRASLRNGRVETRSPILMTKMCALLGGVPLMLGTRIGSEIRQPLGYAIVGGLLVSQLLTLFTTPVVYIYMDRLRHWLWGRCSADRTPSGARRPPQIEIAAAKPGPGFLPPRRCW